MHLYELTEAIRLNSLFGIATQIEHTYNAGKLAGVFSSKDYRWLLKQAEDEELEVRLSRKARTFRKSRFGVDTWLIDEAGLYAKALLILHSIRKSRKI